MQNFQKQKQSSGDVREEERKNGRYLHIQRSVLDVLPLELKLRERRIYPWFQFVDSTVGLRKRWDRKMTSKLEKSRISGVLGTKSSLGGVSSFSPLSKLYFFLCLLRVSWIVMVVVIFMNFASIWMILVDKDERVVNLIKVFDFDFDMILFGIVQ